jgi:hypothetical protein
MTFLGSKMAIAGLALASTLALGGCYDDGYGYGGVSVGYADGGYYGYDSPYYYGGYGYPSYGWYDNFYYPGTGYYVFDRSGRRHRWTDSQRRHWEARRADRGWQGRNDNRTWQGRRDNLGNRADPAPRPPRGVDGRPGWRQGAEGARPGWQPRANRPDRGQAEYRANNRRFSQPDGAAASPRATTPRAERPGRSGQPNRGRRD